MLEEIGNGDPNMGGETSATVDIGIYLASNSARRSQTNPPSILGDIVLFCNSVFSDAPDVAGMAWLG